MLNFTFCASVVSLALVMFCTFTAATSTAWVIRGSSSLKGGLGSQIYYTFNQRVSSEETAHCPHNVSKVPQGWSILFCRWLWFDLIRNSVPSKSKYLFMTSREQSKCGALGNCGDLVTIRSNLHNAILWPLGQLQCTNKSNVSYTQQTQLSTCPWCSSIAFHLHKTKKNQITPTMALRMAANKTSPRLQCQARKMETEHLHDVHKMKW